MGLTIRGTILTIHRRNPAGMADERARATVRMPEEAYQRLCNELPAFNTDTARFQFLIQFYFDYRSGACSCSSRANPPAESRVPPARAHLEEATASSSRKPSSETDLDSESDAANRTPHDSEQQSAPQTDGGQEHEADSSQPTRDETNQ